MTKLSWYGTLFRNSRSYNYEENPNSGHLRILEQESVIDLPTSLLADCKQPHNCIPRPEENMLKHTTDPRLVTLDIPAIRINSLLDGSYAYKPLLEHRSNSVLPFSIGLITIPQVYLNRVSLNNWVCFYVECSSDCFYPVHSWMISMAIDMVKDKIKAMQKACEERGEPLFPDYPII